jgi:1-deoxy-D-xylulose-5-phosphate reductoisomerase
LNAAKEIAVAAFLERRIRFDQIHHVNQQCLFNLSPNTPNSLDDLLALDQEARALADVVVNRFTHP